MNDYELTDDEVQLSILTMLYNKRRETKDAEVLRQKIIEALNIPEQRIDFNSEYLEEKMLIDILGKSMDGWVYAKITAMGIDAINNKEEKKKTLKFLGVKIPLHIENKIAFINFNF
jgi:hypothetical protein